MNEQWKEGHIEGYSLGYKQALEHIAKSLDDEMQRVEQQEVIKLGHMDGMEAAAALIEEKLRSNQCQSQHQAQTSQKSG